MGRSDRRQVPDSYRRTTWSSSAYSSATIIRQSWAKGHYTKSAPPICIGGIDRWIPNQFLGGESWCTQDLHKQAPSTWCRMCKHVSTHAHPCSTSRYVHRSAPSFFLWSQCASHRIMLTWYYSIGKNYANVNTLSSWWTHAAGEHALPISSNHVFSSGIVTESCYATYVFIFSLRFGT